MDSTSADAAAGTPVQSDRGGDERRSHRYPASNSSNNNDLPSLQKREQSVIEILDDTSMSSSNSDNEMKPGSANYGDRPPPPPIIAVRYDSAVVAQIRATLHPCTALPEEKEEMMIRVDLPSSHQETPTFQGDFTSQCNKATLGDDFVKTGNHAIQHQSLACSPATHERNASAGIQVKGLSRKENFAVTNDHDECKKPALTQEGSIISDYGKNSIAQTEHRVSVDPSEPNDKLVDVTPRFTSKINSCWTCSVKVSTLEFLGDETYYLMRVHPLLRTPVCSVCEEAAVGAELVVEENDSDDEDKEARKRNQSNPDRTTYCTSCSGHEDDFDAEQELFLCDNEHSRLNDNSNDDGPGQSNPCGRAFCFDCVVKCYGGGEVGLAHAHKLQSDSSEEKWLCPLCDPSPALQSLQIAGSDDSTNELDDTIDRTERGPCPLSEETLVSQLAAAEAEKKRALELMEDNALEQKRQEIRQELIEACTTPLQQQELEDAVQEEIALYEECFLKHLRRVDVSISELQDELGNVDLAKFYQHYDQLNGAASTRSSNNGEGDKDDDEEDLPMWVKSANKALNKAEKSKQRSTFDPLDPRVYESEIYEDVECLEPIDEYGDEEVLLCRETWRCGIRPSARMVEIAQEEEDQIFAKEKIQVRAVVDDAQDEAELRIEKKQEQNTFARNVLRSRSKRRPGIQNSKSSGSQTTASAPAKQDGSTASNGATASEDKQKSLPEGESVSGRQGSSPRSTPSYTSNISYAQATCDRTHSNTAGSSALNAKRASSIPKGPLNETKIGSEQNRNTSRSRRHWEIFENDDDADDADDDDESDSPTMTVSDAFVGSELVLCGTAKANSPSRGKSRSIRTVTVARELSKVLKHHQKEGIRFMWQRAFSDFETYEHGNTEEVGGCLLAHIMGSGKSLQVIALLHAAMRHPSMTRGRRRGGILRTAILIVPVNTLENWVSEFDMWLHNIEPGLKLYRIYNGNMYHRWEVVSSWAKRGGVLLIGEAMFRILMNREEFREKMNPDILVLDEAHTMLKNSKSGIYKALGDIKTPRRIGMTGSPFQNNILEYYDMVRYVQPDVLDFIEASTFERIYGAPIQEGMAQDASAKSNYNSLVKAHELKSKISRYVHRFSDIQKELPSIRQVVLRVRASKVQSRLYQAFKRCQKQDEKRRSFFAAYQALRPIHNHPGCLLISSDGDANKKTTALDEIENDKWWESTVLKIGRERLMSVQSGFKIVILLHILAESVDVGDKVLVFSQCLKSLNYIENVLERNDWGAEVASLREAYPNTSIGGWKKNADYYRFDGSTDATERGSLISQFSESQSAKVLLISSLAGGVGINLVCANRVILLDTHFNPVHAIQAQARAYRYGQNKAVHCYRLLTEGTVEDKVYARIVNKTGLANRIIDGKTIERNFTQRELQDLRETDLWVQCDSCNKWRMLMPGSDEIDVEGDFFCWMNKSDPENSICTASEKTPAWYALRQSDVNVPAIADTSVLESHDSFLDRLLAITAFNDSKIISQHHFHDQLLETKNDVEAIEIARLAAVEEESHPLSKPVESEIAKPRYASKAAAANMATEIIDVDSIGEPEAEIIRPKSGLVSGSGLQVICSNEQQNESNIQNASCEPATNTHTEARGRQSKAPNFHGEPDAVSKSERQSKSSNRLGEREVVAGPLQKPLFESEQPVSPVKPIDRNVSSRSLRDRPSGNDSGHDQNPPPHSTGGSASAQISICAAVDLEKSQPPTAQSDEPCKRPRENLDNCFMQKKSRTASQDCTLTLRSCRVEDLTHLADHVNSRRASRQLMESKIIFKTESDARIDSEAHIAAMKPTQGLITSAVAAKRKRGASSTPSNDSQVRSLPCDQSASIKEAATRETIHSSMSDHASRDSEIRKKPFSLFAEASSAIEAATRRITRSWTRKERVIDLSGSRNCEEDSSILACDV